MGEAYPARDCFAWPAMTTKSVRLAALEGGAALFHEGGAALGIVLAGEAFGDEALAQIEVALALGLQCLAHRDLGRADRQWRVGGDRVAIVLDVAFELIGRHQAVDQ